MTTKIQKSVQRLVDRHGSLRAAAKATGLSAGYLSRLRSGQKTNPTISTLALLGLKVEVTKRYTSFVYQGDNYELAA